MPKLEIQTETRQYFTCTACGDKARRKFYVDHLIAQAAADNTNISFGPWDCTRCGIGYAGVVSPEGELIVDAVRKGTGFRDCFVLLRYAASTRNDPLHVILQTSHASDDLAMEAVEPGSSSIGYYYDEHTCPTNWTREIHTIVAGQDSDPHGVFEFVAAMDFEDVLKALKDYPEHADITTVDQLKGSDHRTLHDVFFAHMRME